MLPHLHLIQNYFYFFEVAISVVYCTHGLYRAISYISYFLFIFEVAISVVYCTHGLYRAISYISYFWPPEVEFHWISSTPDQVKKWKASHILLWESSESIASRKSSLFSWFHFRVVLSFFVLFFDVFPLEFGWLLMLRYNGIWLIWHDPWLQISS